MINGKEPREAHVEFGLEAESYDQNYQLGAGRYPDHVYQIGRAHV